MLWVYLEAILEYLVAKIGAQVLDWSLRQVIDWLKANPESDRECTVTSVNRYLSEYDPDVEGFYWERKRH